MEETLWDLAEGLFEQLTTPAYGPEVFDNVRALGTRKWPEGANAKKEWRKHYQPDLTTSPPKLVGWERAAANRDLIVFHQTGGEFGIVSYQQTAALAHVERLLREGREAELVPLAYGTEWRGGEGAPKDLLAERLAMATRFWNIEYHYVITRGGLTLHNAPLSVRTAHGSDGNDGFGISFEGKWPAYDEGGSVANAGALQAQLHLALNHLQAWMRAQGVPNRQFSASAHRCFEEPRYRAGDPGVWLWREVIRPVIEARTDLLIRPAQRLGSGRPLPQSWEPSSPFDNLGALPPLTVTAALARDGEGLRIDLTPNHPLGEDLPSALTRALPQITVKVKNKTHKPAPTDWSYDSARHVLSLHIPAPVPPGRWTVTLKNKLKSAPLVFSGELSNDAHQLPKTLIFTLDPEALD